ncbi:lipoprotein-releasing ABC transporter ATP-binding protein LolD [Acinetobacter sp. c3-l95]|uniref:lipoprotein-releasing ABC transporter ATP-binding protein LolD n=1 Tax=Acinetobacter sp. c3-l95 TaxID=3342804 RepID=UPI0035B85C65
MNDFTQRPIVLQAKDVYRRFDEGKHQVDVLKGINLSIQQGEFVAIIGASGSGKSTLLHLLGGLDRPSQGEVLLMGQRFDHLNETKRGDLRNQHLGFVYQFHHLLGEFTALENVCLPLMIRPNAKFQDVRAKATALLERVGLQHRLTHKPSELSGGERQRVALARALITEPNLVLADEPTGNLDRNTAQSVFGLFNELRREKNMSLLIVTHDESLAKEADRVLHMRDGLWLET